MVVSRSPGLLCASACTRPASPAQQGSKQGGGAVSTTRGWGSGRCVLGSSTWVVGQKGLGHNFKKAMLHRTALCYRGAPCGFAPNQSAGAALATVAQHEARSVWTLVLAMPTSKTPCAPLMATARNLDRSAVQKQKSGRSLRSRPDALCLMPYALLRRARTAVASPCSTGTVCARLMQASVTDTPCCNGWPGTMSWRPSCRWLSIIRPVMRASPAAI